MYEYYRGKLIAARHEEDRMYSDEIERLYQEVRCKNLEDIQKMVRFYENKSFLMRFCLKIGLSRESPRVIGYKIRLEELLKESDSKISDPELK